MPVQNISCRRLPATKNCKQAPPSTELVHYLARAFEESARPPRLAGLGLGLGLAGRPSSAHQLGVLQRRQVLRAPALLGVHVPGVLQRGPVRRVRVPPLRLRCALAQQAQRQLLQRSVSQCGERTHRTPQPVQS